MTCCVCQVRGGSEVCAVCDGESRLRLSRAAKAEGAAEERARVVADLRQGATYARKTPENVFSLSIAHALEAAADRYEAGAHEDGKKERGHG